MSATFILFTELYKKLKKVLYFTIIVDIISIGFFVAEKRMDVVLLSDSFKLAKTFPNTY